MEKDITRELYEAFKNAQTTNEKEKAEAEKYIDKLLQEISQEDLEDEIRTSYQYTEFLRKKLFYIFQNDFDEFYDDEGVLVAFTPNNIYSLWLERDMSFYEIIAECTDEYLQDVIDFWVASQYDPAAVEMLVHYITKRREFTDLDK